MDQNDGIRTQHFLQLKEDPFSNMIRFSISVLFFPIYPLSHEVSRSASGLYSQREAGSAFGMDHGRIKDGKD